MNDQVRGLLDKVTDLSQPDKKLLLDCGGGHLARST